MKKFMFVITLVIATVVAWLFVERSQPNVAEYSETTNELAPNNLIRSSTMTDETEEPGNLLLASKLLLESEFGSAAYLDAQASEIKKLESKPFGYKRSRVARVNWEWLHYLEESYRQDGIESLRDVELELFSDASCTGNATNFARYRDGSFTVSFECAKSASGNYVGNVRLRVDEAEKSVGIGGNVSGRSYTAWTPSEQYAVVLENRPARRSDDDTPPAQPSSSLD